MSSTSSITLSTRLELLNAGIHDANEAATPEAARTAAASAAASATGQAAPVAPSSASVTISAAGAQMSAVAAAPAPVDYTNRIKPSGNINIDALLAGGSAWFHTAGASGAVPSAVARHELTFSFLDSASGLSGSDANGFQALDETHKQAVRDALAYISTVAGVTFTEVASGGDIKYGSNVQAASAGYASYPDPMAGSKVMLANNQGSYADTSKGAYTREVILHETSHALGLKHPGNYNAGGGGTPGPYLPAATDNRGNTIMSYKDASNVKEIKQVGGMYVTSTINPDTLQANDVMALQYLYGAPGTVNAQDFSWSDGQAMSQTIWSSNTDSTIDLSNQTGTNIVDLRAGNFSSIGIHDAYASVGGKAAYTATKTMVNGKLVPISSVLGTPTYTGINNVKIATGSHIRTAVGGSGNDTFVSNGEGNHLDGGVGDDAFFLSGGDDVVTGGAGSDTVYLKNVSGAVWTLSDDHATATLTKTVTDPKTKVVTTTTLSTVTLDGIEHVGFWSGSGTGTAIKGTGAFMYDAFSGTSGNDTFVAKGKSDISGGDGTNQFFVGDSSTVTGGSGDDSIYLKTVAGAAWSFNADRTQAVLTKSVTDPKTKVVTTTTLQTVNMTGIEHIGFWNGTTAKATGMAFDQFTGGAGDDTFVAKGQSVIRGGDGTNAYYLGGDATVTGGAGSDTVYLKTVAGATWSLSADRTLAQLIKSITNPTTHAVTTTTLQTISMNGIEHVGFWNGTTAKPLAKPAPLASELAGGQAAAYASGPDPSSGKLDVAA
ncbi:hypothetical protein [Variovorax sp. GT1P44]|uniref:hypothetical protein n=1 Tax=Variovorax sp. GT1P44 TaxID=3443742 RepID=UPI003F47FD80